MKDENKTMKIYHYNVASPSSSSSYPAFGMVQPLGDTCIYIENPQHHPPSLEADD